MASEKSPGPNPHDNHKRTYLLLWLLLSVALIVVITVAFLDDITIGGFTLKKGTYRDVILAENTSGPSDEDDLEMAENGERKVIAETDTTVKTVLIFGDSMTILIANRLAAYGEKNGYDVVSVTWDSSSSVSWSACDTLDNFIKRYHPDFIMVSLGSNELFLKNFDLRRPNVEKLIKKMGDIPFVWIGPPNWKEDQGFNPMMRKTLPKGTFFDSNGLGLPRGPDNIHPTPRGGVIWTDSIMSWMRYTPHPIPSVRPDPSVTTRSHKSFYYRANGGKGTPPANLSSAPSEEGSGETETSGDTQHEPETIEAPVAPSSPETAPVHEAPATEPHQAPQAEPAAPAEQ